MAPLSIPKRAFRKIAHKFTGIAPAYQFLQDILYNQSKQPLDPNRTLAHLKLHIIALQNYCKDQGVPLPSYAAFTATLTGRIEFHTVDSKHSINTYLPNHKQPPRLPKFPTNPKRVHQPSYKTVIQRFRALNLLSAHAHHSSFPPLPSQLSCTLRFFSSFS